MGKINLLSSAVFNRIAAGEVIERPFSVVKELVENSIDAGANKITVSVTDGGLSNITVTDNGDGIFKDDLKNALLPHATSKIADVEDLDDIKTLGFRGEALASIASVSKITIESQRNEDELGGKIYCEGGKIGEISDVSSVKGTEISVSNLFFNAPVRAKFLKSARAEESEITSTVARFILGNPEISFTLLLNGKKQLQSFGDGISSAFLAVYGLSVMNNCFFVDTEKHGIKVKGYIGKHYYTKPNRTYQTVFLNKRYIVNNTVSSAVSNAYSSYMMKRQYPFFFLSIDMPPEAVDVNVHPQKTDVRFLNNQVVYGTIYSIISNVLDGTSEAVDIAKTFDEIKNENVQEKPVDFKSNYVSNNKSERVSLLNVKTLPPLTFSDSKTVDENSIGFEKSNKNESEKIDIFAENKKYILELENKRKEAEKQSFIEQSQITIEKDLRVIGQALNTFLILEDGTDLYFIDQHAAHERLLFDKLTAQYNDNNVITQPLLIPYVLDVNGEESEFLNSKKDFFLSIGFEIEDFGVNSFKISSVPAYLSEIDLKKFIRDVLSDINELKTLSLDRLLFDKLAQKACKAAIKGGDKLSENEIDALLKALKGNLGLKCPHGRPVAIKITRTEIDKWFKRIV